MLMLHIGSKRVSCGIQFPRYNMMSPVYSNGNTASRVIFRILPTHSYRIHALGATPPFPKPQLFSTSATSCSPSNFPCATIVGAPLPNP